MELLANVTLESTTVSRFIPSTSEDRTLLQSTQYQPISPLYYATEFDLQLSQQASDSDRHLKECSSVLNPTITNIINISYRYALFRPILKQSTKFNVMYVFKLI